MTRLWQVGFAIQGLFVVLLSAGAYLGALPTSLPAIPGADLAGHALFVGLLAFFLDGALGYRPLWRGAALPRLAPALVIALAGVEELAQRLSARRSSSLWDFAADVAGVCALSWLSRRLDEALRARAARAC